MKILAVHNNQKFIIEDDLPEVEYYLYVFSDNDVCVADYLQNSEASEKKFALEEFDVPLSSWQSK